jgi:hypothetical protein
MSARTVCLDMTSDRGAVLLLLRFVAATMTIATSLLYAPIARPNDAPPARLAIYYGYPSLVNGSQGDVDKAAAVFGSYDVVVLGDGLEFGDHVIGRYPAGDPLEHQRTLEIITSVRKRNPATSFYGYVCLGEIPWPEGQRTALSSEELKERMHLWKQMGVSGIFLDEAGYDFAAINRKRQNLAVGMAHELGLSAFMNAYFLEDLFSLRNDFPHAAGSQKNPEGLPSLLDRRDLFLLESFEVKNGTYVSSPAVHGRLSQALEYRQRHGSRIFATTTTTEAQPFRREQFNFAWWTAKLYGLDGFGWGEPDFSAANNSLPERRCGGESPYLPPFDPSSAVSADSPYFWRKAGRYVVIVDADTHSVHRISDVDTALGSKGVKALLSSYQPHSLLTCEEQ